jgi:hypothetical protein
MVPVAMQIMARRLIVHPHSSSETFRPIGHGRGSRWQLTFKPVVVAVLEIMFTSVAQPAKGSPSQLELMNKRSRWSTLFHLLVLAENGRPRSGDEAGRRGVVHPISTDAGANGCCHHASAVMNSRRTLGYVRCPLVCNYERMEATSKVAVS